MKEYPDRAAKKSTQRTKSSPEDVKKAQERDAEKIQIDEDVRAASSRSSSSSAQAESSSNDSGTME